MRRLRPGYAGNLYRHYRIRLRFRFNGWRTDVALPFPEKLLVVEDLRAPVACPAADPEFRAC